MQLWMLDVTFRQIVHLISFKTPIFELLLGIRVPKQRTWVHNRLQYHRK